MKRALSRRALLFDGLRRLRPRQDVAVVHGDRCVLFCSVCVERCPVPGALEWRAGRPAVVADRCDGCGSCAEVCPAPELAIEIRRGRSSSQQPLATRTTERAAER